MRKDSLLQGYYYSKLPKANKFLNSYGPGGQTTDGCPPNWVKDSRGNCVPSGFTMPINRIDVPTTIQEKQRKDAEANEINKRNKATAKRQFISQGKKSTPESEARRIRLNQQYVSQLPNAQIDEQGNVSRVNPNRSVTGASENFMSRREDKAAEHALGAIEGAGYVTGASELAGAGYNALRNALGESMESGLLSKTWRLNPKAYQYNLPENTMWRGIGKEGMEDAVASGVFRSKQNVVPEYFPGTKLQLNKSFGDATYFTPKFNTAASYGDSYIAELPRDVANWKNRYRRGKTWSQFTTEQLPIEKGRILKKDWLRGYKPIETPSVGNSFKSEIDWGAWNSEIPSNKALMDEYHAIEQQAKANGSWMKNADGSLFQGTPEQFVQQNSENFKKAFSNGFNKTYRGANNNSTFRGNLASSDNPNIGAVFAGNKNSAVPKYGSFDRVIRPEELGRGFEGSPGYMELAYKPTNNNFTFSAGLENWDNINRNILPIEHRNMETVTQMARENPSIVTTDDIARYIQDKNIDYADIDNIIDGTFFGKEIIYNHKPNNYLKSLWYNNGMFDMTNPNIYKGLVPPAILLGAGAATQQKKQGGWMNKYAPGGTTGDPNQPYHPITNPEGYKVKLSDVLKVAEKNKQAALDTRPQLKQGHKELPYEKKAREERLRKEAQENSALAQTMGLFTPSGSNPAAGAIGAETFTNMNPLITGPIMSTFRLYGAGRSMVDPNTYNPYFGSDKGVVGNILGGLNLAGDIGMIGATTGLNAIKFPRLNFNKSKTLLPNRQIFELTGVEEEPIIKQDITESIGESFNNPEGKKILNEININEHYKNVHEKIKALKEANLSRRYWKEQMDEAKLLNKENYSDDFTNKDIEDYVKSNPIEQVYGTLYEKGKTPPSLKLNLNKTGDINPLYGIENQYYKPFKNPQVNEVLDYYKIKQEGKPLSIKKSDDKSLQLAKTRYNNYLNDLNLYNENINNQRKYWANPTPIPFIDVTKMPILKSFNKYGGSIKEYGGPLQAYYQGKMTGPNIFSKGGQSNEYFYNKGYGVPYKYGGPTKMNKFGYLVDKKNNGGDISIPKLPDMRGPLLQFYYAKTGGELVGRSRKKA